MPKSRFQCMWLDSNPFARPAGERTEPSNPAHLLASDMTQRVLDTLDLRLLHLAQESNRIWFIRHLLPTHISKRSPTVTHNSFMKLYAEDMDPHWWWSSLDESGRPLPAPSTHRPVTELETCLYLHLSILETSQDLPFEPLSLFVRDWRGQGDRLVFFSPHFCVLDPFYYTSLNFLAAADLIERVERCIEELTNPSKVGDVADDWASEFAAFSATLPRRPTADEGDIDFFTDWVHPDEPATPSPPLFALASMYSSLAHGFAWVHSDKSDLGLLGQLFELRRFEYKTQIALDSDLSDELLRIAARQLLRTEDTDLLRSYRPSRSPHAPQSIIGDLIVFYGTMRISQLAKREEDVKAGVLVKGDYEYEVLMDALASEGWRVKCRNLGVEEFFVGDIGMFTRAWNKQRRSHTWAKHLRHHAIMVATRTCRLYISLHFAETDAWAGLRGRLSSATSTSSVSFGDKVTSKTGLSLKHACSKCAAQGWPACTLPYDVALALGLPQRTYSAAEIEENLREWQKEVDELAERKNWEYPRLSRQLEEALQVMGVLEAEVGVADDG